MTIFRGAQRCALDRHSTAGGAKRARPRERTHPPVALRLCDTGRAQLSPRHRPIAEDSHGNFWMGTDGGGLKPWHAPDGTVVKGVPPRTRREHRGPAGPRTRYTRWRSDGPGPGVGWPTGRRRPRPWRKAPRRQPDAIRFKVLSRRGGACRATPCTEWSRTPGGRIWLSSDAGLVSYGPPETGTLKDLPPARHGPRAGRGVSTSGAYHIGCADGRLCFGRPGRIQHLRSPRASRRTASPRTWALERRVEVLGVPGARPPGPTGCWSRIDLGYSGANIVSLDFGAPRTSPRRSVIALAYRMAGPD